MHVHACVVVKLYGVTKFAGFDPDVDIDLHLDRYVRASHYWLRLIFYVRVSKSYVLDMLASCLDSFAGVGDLARFSTMDHEPHMS